MKQLNKHLLITLSLPFLLFSSSSFAMLTSILKPTMQKIAEQRSEQQAQTLIKDKIGLIKSLNTVADVDHEIDQLKNGIYMQALTTLTLMTGKSYDMIKKRIDLERDLIQDLLQEEYSHITQEHDNKIPSHLYNDIISTLQKEKINPNNIKLKYVIGDNPGLLASAKSRLLKPDYPHFAKPRIRLYDALTNKSKSQQLFTYSHELSHILLRHGTMNIIADSHDDTDTYSSKVNILTSIQEREADIRTASKNSQLAYAGMTSRCDLGHAEIIDDKSHCRDMQLMYALMKQKEKLVALKS